MSYDNVKPSGGETGTPLNMQKRLAFFSRHNIQLADKRIIDCGCGTGQYVLEFLNQGADAWGVEYDAGKVIAYQQRYPEIAQRVRQGDIESLDYPDEIFDLALLNEVLEHVPNERNGLSEVFRLLRPGGILVVFSPNRCFPFESHGVYRKNTTSKIPIYTPFIPWLPLNLGNRLFDYWARNYWPHELRALIQSAGFRIIQTDFLWQTFENISGYQLLPVRLLRTPLRGLAKTLERTPLVKNFGVTQAVMAQKPMSPK